MRLSWHPPAFDRCVFFKLRTVPVYSERTDSSIFSPLQSSITFPLWFQKTGGGKKARYEQVLLSIFTHVSNSHANLLGQKKCLHEVFTPTGVVPAVSLFCNTNMAAPVIGKIHYYFKPFNKRNEKSWHSHIFLFSFLRTKYFWLRAFPLHLCKHSKWIITSN